MKKVNRTLSIKRMADLKRQTARDIFERKTLKFKTYEEYVHWVDAGRSMKELKSTNSYVNIKEYMVNINIEIIYPKEKK